MKKFIIALAAMLIISAGSVLAEDNGTVLLNDALANNTVQINNEEGKLTKAEDGSYILENSEDAVISFGEMDGIIEADMSFSIGDESSEWIGFDLMSQDPAKRCWATTCYVAIVKANGVEIQAFNPENKSGFLASFAYDLPQNEKINVKTGVIPTDKGNYVFIKLGDTLFGAYDHDNGVTEKGYFCIEGKLNGVTLYETESIEEEIPAVEVSYDSKTNNMIADVKNADENGTEINWYLSTNEFIYDNTSKLADLAAFELIEDYNEPQLLLQGNEVGKYTLCIVKTKGINVYSNVEYADPVEYCLSNGFVGCVGFTKAVANGKEIDYDATDMVYPDVYDDVVFMPFRGVMEGFGWPVTWDSETRVAAAYPPNGTAPASFCVDKIGFINFMNLMSASMVKAPMLIKNRTFLDVYSTSYILDYDNIIVDEDNGVIVMSPIDIELDENQIYALYDYISGM